MSTVTIAQDTAPPGKDVAFKKKSPRTATLNPKVGLQGKDTHGQERLSDTLNPCHGSYPKSRGEAFIGLLGAEDWFPCGGWV